jgi:hypothetical protein
VHADSALDARMKVALNSFRGEAPRVTPRALPPNGAQRAVNARLQSGDLEAWRQFVEIERLAIAPQTIYRLNGAWMSWATDVDVARSPIPGDDTFRVYLTGPDEYAQPRWTNYALAFQSPGGAAPVVTRPIGVPASDSAPTLVVGVDTSPTTFSIDILDEGDSLATSWSTSPLVSSGGVRSEVSQSATIGNPAPSYEITFENNEGNSAYLYRNFGVESAAVVTMTADFQFTSGDGSRKQMLAHVMNPSTGNGISVGYASDSGALSIILAAGWISRSGSAIASDVIGVLSFGVWYSVNVTVLVNSDGTQTVTARLLQGSTVLGEVTATNTFNIGGYCGFVAETTHVDSVDEFRTYYDNIHVQASGATGATIINVATSYVFTLVNDLGEESAPSPASATILRPDGVSVTVTTSISLPTGISADYEIETKRIYRSVADATGAIFRLVAEIPLSQADYVDTLTDEQLGEALETKGWSLPPDDLRGILALPNGIMVGFRRNQLCFSAQNRPHAWPPAYRLNTDTDIVAIGAIDTAVVIGTMSFPYVAQGQSPSDYAAAKLEVPQACVSKRSLAYVSGVGVVFASPDGLMAISGVAAPVNITRGTFTRTQWQDLEPESVLAISHDDVCHFFFDTGLASGGYALDFKPDGFGLIELAYHATAAHADPTTDALYLALDENDEPTTPYLPQPSTAPAPDGQTIYQFDGDENALMTYLWRGRLNLMQAPYAPMFVRVQAQDYDNLIVRGYQDGLMQFENVVTSAEEFRVPTQRTAKVSYEQELIGTSRVRMFDTAEDVGELD